MSKKVDFKEMEEDFTRRVRVGFANVEAEQTPVSVTTSDQVFGFENKKKVEKNSAKPVKEEVKPIITFPKVVLNRFNLICYFEKLLNDFKNLCTNIDNSAESSARRSMILCTLNFFRYVAMVTNDEEWLVKNTIKIVMNDVNEIECPKEIASEFNKMIVREYIDSVNKFKSLSK